jgi:hypothetical protein
LTQEVLPLQGNFPEGSSSYNAFINSIKTDATKTDYLKALKRFMQFCAIEPSYDSLFFNYDVKLIQSRIIDFIIDCKNARQLSPAAINLFVAINQELQLVTQIQKPFGAKTSYFE